VTGGHDIRLQRIVAAAPDEAFTHWVNAEARRGWYAPEDGWIVEAQTDLRIGGPWRVQFGPSRDEMYLEHGVFEEIDRPHRVVYTTLYEFPDGRPSFDTHVTVTFEPHADGTLLTVVDRGYPTDEQRARHAGGWPYFLDAFARTLE
jgi:uncharacterized protein YndB with AHSA1/START domain